MRRLYIFGSVIVALQTSVGLRLYSRGKGNGNSRSSSFCTLKVLSWHPAAGRP